MVCLLALLAILLDCEERVKLSGLDRDRAWFEMIEV
jgi:hypothetical protein